MNAVGAVRSTRHLRARGRQRARRAAEDFDEAVRIPAEQLLPDLAPRSLSPPHSHSP